MTPNEIEKKLKRVYNTQHDIEFYCEQKERVMATATHTAADPKGTGKRRKVDSAAAKLVELQEIIDQRIKAYTKYWVEAVEIIDEIDNNKYRQLFRERYMNFRTWEKAAAVVGYEEGHARHLRRIILAQLAAKLTKPNNTQKHT